MALAVSVAAVSAAAVILPVQAQETSCGITVYAGGRLVWVALPCEALTPPPSVTRTPPSATPTPTLTATATVTPTATDTPLASATPSDRNDPFPSPTPQVACILTTEGDYNVNIRSGPGTGYSVVGSWAANSQKPVHRWIRNLKGEMWVNVDIGAGEGFSARWVLRLVNRDECPDELLASGQ